jgi:3',5'-cyclic AMP phosphodiesterase CpdA
MIRTVVQLSDLHYGKPFQYSLEPILLSEIKALAPDMVILSGDLTQRALKRQYQQAQAFLERLPRPYLVIPGNHDVPIYNVFARLFRPLANYKAHIRSKVDMVVRTEGLVALGLNSAYGWTNDGGRLTKEQLTMAQETFAQEPGPEMKILVTHHHFVCPPGVHQSPLPEALLSRFREWGVELVLTGHTHLTHVVQRPDGLVLLQSGTATATRWKKLKKRVNSFNVLSISAQEINIQIREYSTAHREYAAADEFTFLRNVR